MGPIGEAFVRVHADTRGMREEVQSGTKHAFAGLKGTIAGLGIGFGAFEFLKSAVSDAAQTQAALVALRSAVDSSGASWKIQGTTVDEVLRKMRLASGASLPDLAQGFLRIVTATKDTKTALRDLHIAEDLSVARHLGLAQASVVLAKAEGGSSTALMRLGIMIPKVTVHYDSLKKRVEEAAAGGAKFTAAQKLVIAEHLAEAKALDKQATRTQIITTLQARFGGQTEKFAHTAAGAYARFHESVRAVLETIGGALLPGLSGAANSAGAFLQKLHDSPKFTNALKTSVHALGEGFHIAGVFIKAVVPPLAAVAGTALRVAKAIGAPALLTGLAAYKAFGLVMSAQTAIRARWAQVTAQATAAEVGAAAGQTAEAGTTSALTVALAANTAALEANAGAAKLNLGGLSTLGAGARTAARDAEAAGAAIAGAGTASATATGLLSRVGGGLSRFGGGLFRLAGGWKTVAAVGIAALAGGIAYLVTRESTWQLATDAARASLDRLDTALNRAKTSAEDLARSKVDVAVARTGVETAKLAEAQARHTLETTKAKKGSLEYLQLQNELRTAHDGVRVAELNVKDAITAHNAAITKNTQDTKTAIAKRREFRESEEKLITTLHRQQALIAKMETLPRGGAAAALLRRSLGFETAGAGLRRFVEELNREQVAHEKTSPGLSHNIVLLKQFVEATGKLPTAKEVRLALNNRDASLSLDSFIGRLGGLGDKTAQALGSARAASRFSSIGVSLGTAMIRGVVAGIQIDQIQVNLAMINAALHGIFAGKGAIGAKSPSTLAAAQIGRPIAQGIAEGVRQEVPASSAATKRYVDGYFGDVGGFIKRKRGEWFVSIYGKDPAIPLHRDISAFLNEYMGRGLSPAATHIVGDFWKKNSDAIIANSRRFSAAAAGGPSVESVRKHGADLGAAIVQGIAGGVLAEQVRINLAVIGAALQGIGAGKKAIGASSPSTVAADQIGTPLAEGIIAGVRGQKTKMARELGANINDIIRSAAAYAQQQEVTQFGSSAISQALASGFSSASASVSNQMAQSMRDAITTAIANVRGAVDQAKQSLSSLGQSLAGSITSILDERAARAAQAPTVVTGRLAARFAAIRKQILGGDQSPALAREAQRISTQIQASASAKGQIDTVKLDAEKKAIARRIDSLTTLFDLGRISERTLEQGIRAILVKNRVVPGRALTREEGITINEQVKATVRGIREQARALREGPRAPGAGFAPQIVRPLETLRQEQRNIAQVARDQRDQLIGLAKQQLAATKALGGKRKSAAKAAAKAAAKTGGSKKAKQFVGSLSPATTSTKHGLNRR